ncbi:MAG: AMP-binding protein [Candidatus Omnitrophota bacterium]|nr:AMP-binding protein [Candidatus Omnitrophota bacterium]
MDTKSFLIKNAQKYPDKPALIFNDKTISFSQLKDIVFKLACALSIVGIKKQDKVAIYLANSPEYIYSYLALFSLGAVVIPLDFMLKEEEIILYLRHSEAKALIAQPRHGISLAKIKNEAEPLQKVIIKGESSEEIKTSIDFDKILNEAKTKITENEISPDDDALIMYTSGTSGLPKGVLLNYRHLDGSPEAMRYFVDLTDTDIKLCCLPLSHSGGLIYLQNSLIFGITLILMERFSPLEFLKLIEKYRVSCFHIVPSMYYAILQLKEFEKHDLSSLRWMVVFGAPSAPEVLARFNQHCPNTHLLNGWGLTETCPPNTVIPLGSKNIASVGKPAPWVQIAVIDEFSEPVAPGEIGEIAIKSWVVMKGYYKNTEETNRVLKNGWFHTGDLGRFDEDGFLYIAGRKKEMIKAAGQLVYAPEVESVIQKHQDIIETAVIGMPDKLRGEIVKAFVVKSNQSALTEKDLRVFCEQHLAHFKVPHAIEFIDSLPKNRTGKIDKELLKRSSK